jgi:hypothetical protein
MRTGSESAGRYAAEERSATKTYKVSAVSASKESLSGQVYNYAFARPTR